MPDITAVLRRTLAAAALCATLLTTMGVWAVPSDAEQPIHIRADAAELDEAKGIATYTGSVRMDQGTLRVTADTMVIELKNEQVVRITAVGKRAHYQQQLRTKESEVLADAETIVYHTQDERVELIGDAFLTQDGNEFRGQTIRYDMRAGKVDAKADQAGGVQMILKPARPGP
ncbi:MAG: lipopolysaccharide transport periplasmic protein LptA [Gammaproteobacteria bacterium]|nr:lipopolysaccharide transport periplasmic protein LptA [Gammaproteobacteria bacterium]